MTKEEIEKCQKKGKRLFWAVCVGVLYFFWWLLINNHGVPSLHH